MTTIYDIAQGLHYDLSETIPLNLEKFSPFEFTVGEISLPVKFPFTKRNTKAMGLVNNINLLAHPKTSREVLVSHGSFQRNGQLTILKAKEGDYIEGNIIFSNSVFYRKAHNTAMEDIFNIERTDYSTAEGWTEYFAKVMTGWNGIQDDFRVFEVLCKDPLSNRVYGRLNELSHMPLNPNRVLLGKLKHINQIQVNIIYDGEPLQVTLLPGHNITPFLTLNYVIGTIFNHFGYTINLNLLRSNIPFYDDITVLNNTSDTIVGGRLNYSMLVPTCSAAEFLRSVSLLLGCGFSFNGKDVVPVLAEQKYAAQPIDNIKPKDFTHYLSSPYEVIFESKKSLVLSSNAINEELSYKIPLNQTPDILTYNDLNEYFTENTHIQFDSDDGIKYILYQQPEELARIRYALTSDFSWPASYSGSRGIDLSLTEALRTTKNNNFLNFFDQPNVYHYQKIVALFGSQTPSNFKVENHAAEYKVEGKHTLIPDIIESILERRDYVSLNYYDPFQDEEIFPKAFIGDIRRLNSRLSIEEEEGGDKKDCPIMFAYARRGVVKIPAQDPGTYVWAVHFYGSSSTNDITFDPATEANEYIEASLNFSGWKGVYNRSYKQLARVLSKSPIEIKASLNLPLNELDYIESGNPVLIQGNLLLPKSLKYTLENNRARVTEAVFITLRNYIDEDEIDEQALNQQILNQ